MFYISQVNKPHLRCTPFVVALGLLSKKNQVYRPFIRMIQPTEEHTDGVHPVQMYTENP